MNSFWLKKAILNTLTLSLLLTAPAFAQRPKAIKTVTQAA
jgi:hypothetical protein